MILIFPALTWCALAGTFLPSTVCVLTAEASLVCGSAICWQFAHYTLGEDVFETAAGRWITSDCVFSFVCVSVRLLLL